MEFRGRVNKVTGPRTDHAVDGETGEITDRGENEESGGEAASGVWASAEFDTGGTGVSGGEGGVGCEAGEFEVRHGGGGRVE